MPAGVNMTDLDHMGQADVRKLLTHWVDRQGSKKIPEALRFTHIRL